MDDGQKPLIYTIPFEIMSYLFTQLVYMDCEPGWHPQRQAVVLSSISKCLRQAALGTPDLWERIRCSITREESVPAVACLLQHCSSLALSLDVFIQASALTTEQLIPFTDVFFSSEVRLKLKILTLEFYRPPQIWLLQPLADFFSSTLLDLSTFSLSHVRIIDHPHTQSITLPQSVQILDLNFVPMKFAMPLLAKSPNLVECTSFEISKAFPPCYVFSHPVTLPSMKKLTWPMHHGFCRKESAQYLHMPVLKKLTLTDEGCEELQPAAITMICYRVSSTLTSLSLVISPRWNIDDLHELLKLPFLKLKRLTLWLFDESTLSDSIRALMPEDDESKKFEASNLSTLKLLALRHRYPIKESRLRSIPRLLLDLLKAWKVGERSYFRLRCDVYRAWTPELQEELRLVVNGRHLEVFRGRERLVAG